MKMKLQCLFRNKKKVAIYLVIFFIFLSEILTYWLATFSWKSIDCEGKNNCTKILLVADPQLIGLHNEPSFVSPFAIWDSDRYLSKTFSYAFKFARPDLVIFLGDLFDEGSTSTDKEFESYVNRLRLIFEPNWAASIPHIYVPGDNDVGGEGDDLITESKVKRFEESFKQPAIFWTKNLKIYNTNRLLRTKVQRNDGERGPVVGISHLPLLPTNDDYTAQMFKELEPHVLFTAHDHDAYIFKENYDDKPHDDDAPTVAFIEDNEIHVRRIEIGQAHEFRVPTCSYRMGTQKIGYGLTVIDEEEVRFTVLWTPPRFPQLILYATLIFICWCWFLFAICKKLVQLKCKMLPKNESRFP